MTAPLLVERLKRPVEKNNFRPTIADVQHCAVVQLTPGKWTKQSPPE